VAASAVDSRVDFVEVARILGSFLVEVAIDLHTHNAGSADGGRE
jgi:hypothetical protein